MILIYINKKIYLSFSVGILIKTKRVDHFQPCMRGDSRIQSRSPPASSCSSLSSDASCEESTHTSRTHSPVRPEGSSFLGITHPLGCSYLTLPSLPPRPADGETEDELDEEGEWYVFSKLHLYHRVNGYYRFAFVLRMLFPLYYWCLGVSFSTSAWRLQSCTKALSNEDDPFSIATQLYPVEQGVLFSCYHRVSASCPESSSSWFSQNVERNNPWAMEYRDGSVGLRRLLFGLGLLQLAVGLVLWILVEFRVYHRATRRYTVSVGCIGLALLLLSGLAVVLLAATEWAWGRPTGRVCESRGLGFGFYLFVAAVGLNAVLLTVALCFWAALVERKVEARTKWCGEAQRRFWRRFVETCEASVQQTTMPSMMTGEGGEIEEEALWELHLRRRSWANEPIFTANAEREWVPLSRLLQEWGGGEVPWSLELAGLDSASDEEKDESGRPPPKGGAQLRVRLRLIPPRLRERCVPSTPLGSTPTPVPLVRLREEWGEEGVVTDETLHWETNDSLPDDWQWISEKDVYYSAKANLYWHPGRCLFFNANLRVWQPQADRLYRRLTKGPTRPAC